MTFGLGVCYKDSTYKLLHLLYRDFLDYAFIDLASPVHQNNIILSVVLKNFTIVFSQSLKRRFTFEIQSRHDLNC